MAKKKLAKKKRGNKSVVTPVKGRVFVTPKVAKAEARTAKKLGLPSTPTSMIKPGIKGDGIIDYTHTIKARPYTRGQAFIKVDDFEVLLKTEKLPLTKKQKEAAKMEKKARGMLTPEEIAADRERALKRAAKKRRAAKLAAMSKKERTKFLADERARKAKKRQREKLEAMSPEERKAAAAKKAGKKGKVKKPEMSLKEQIETKGKDMTQEQFEKYVQKLAEEGLIARKAKSKEAAKKAKKTKAAKTPEEKEAAKQVKALAKAAKKTAELAATQGQQAQVTANIAAMQAQAAEVQATQAAAPPAELKTPIIAKGEALAKLRKSVLTPAGRGETNQRSRRY